MNPELYVLFYEGKPISHLSYTNNSQTTRAYLSVAMAKRAIKTIRNPGLDRDKIEIMVYVPDGPLLYQYHWEQGKLSEVKYD